MGIHTRQEQETPMLDELQENEGAPPADRTVTSVLEEARGESGDNGESDDSEGLKEEDDKGPSTRTATFVEHLDELRTRLIRSVLYVVVLSAVSFILLQDFTMDVLLNPVRDVLQFDELGGGVIVTAPAEWFFIWCKILLIAGLFLAMPLILYEIHGFIAPALTRAEKGYERWALVFAPLLFAAGVTFGYIVIPFGLRFLYEFTKHYQIKWLISADKYLSFLLTILIGLGLVFQMPLVVAFLAKLEILTPEFLAAKRRYAIVILAIAAAVITPTPDIVNMSIVMVPMLALFEVSILVAKFVTRGGKRRQRRRRKSRRQT